MKGAKKLHDLGIHPALKKPLINVIIWPKNALMFEGTLFSLALENFFLKLTFLSLFPSRRGVNF